eukprot:gene28005-34797_t
MISLDGSSPTLDNTTAAVTVKHGGRQADIVAFYHAAMGSPANSTMSGALARGYLSFPGLTNEIFRKHAPTSVATAKGHLDQTRQGQRSTKAAFVEESEDDWHPQEIASPLSQQTRRTVLIKIVPVSNVSMQYLDLTARMPIPSKRGNQYTMIMYCEDVNYIHAEPMQTRNAAEYVRAFQAGVEFFKNHGVRTTGIRLDGETSNSLESYCKRQEPAIVIGYVPPGTHRANKAERAIRTWKNHFIATLCTTDPSFPLIAWDELLEQAELTLNLMRSSGATRHISAWHQLHGQFNFDHTPIAPPGMRVVVHEKPQKRGSWAPHGVDGFYVGPTSDKHHRCYRVFVKDTQAVRITDTLSWHPSTNLHLPGASITDSLASICVELQSTLTQLAASPNILASQRQPLQVAVPALSVALRALVDIFTPPTSTEITTPDDLATQSTPIAPSGSGPPTSGAHPVEEEQLPVRETVPVEQLSPTLPPPVDVLPAQHAVEEKLDAPAPRSTIQSTRTHRDSKRPARYRTNMVHVACSAVELDQATSLQYPTDSALQTHLELLQAVDRPRRPSPKYLAEMEIKYQVAMCLAIEEFCRPAPTTAEQLHRACKVALADENGDPPLTYGLAKKGPNKQRWEIAEAEEIRRLVASGTIRFIHFSDKPADRTAAYYNPQVKVKIKEGEEIFRVRGTIGGDKVDYTGDVTALTAEMPTIKLLLNAAVSEGAEWMTADIKDFYLGTPLPRKEYMCITRRHLPADIIAEYQLEQYMHNDGVL